MQTCPIVTVCTVEREGRVESGLKFERVLPQHLSISTRTPARARGDPVTTSRHLRLNRSNFDSAYQIRPLPFDCAKNRRFSKTLRSEFFNLKFRPRCARHASRRANARFLTRTHIAPLSTQPRPSAVLIVSPECQDKIHSDYLDTCRLYSRLSIPYFPRARHLRKPRPGTRAVARSY